jgi:hypothetical protein
MFDQNVPLNEKCNVYIRLWEGRFSTHGLNRNCGLLYLKRFTELRTPSAVSILHDAIEILE